MSHASFRPGRRQWLAQFNRGCHGRRCARRWRFAGPKSGTPAKRVEENELKRSSSATSTTPRRSTRQNFRNSRPTNCAQSCNFYKAKATDPWVRVTSSLDAKWPPRAGAPLGQESLNRKGLKALVIESSCSWLWRLHFSTAGHRRPCSLQIFAVLQLHQLLEDDHQRSCTHAEHQHAVDELPARPSSFLFLLITMSP